jgi:hypothetical protein
VYAMRRSKRRKDNIVAGVKTDPKSLAVSIACAEPPVPDHTALLAGSKVLRDACTMIQLVFILCLYTCLLCEEAEFWRVVLYHES